jgi:SAM-dependent methyltransferase
LGECLNYLFDSGNNEKRLASLFRRIYRALAPGGVFIFDIAEPGQIKRRTLTRSFSAGDDWMVAVEKKEDRNILTRRIISFRKVGKHYRRDEETHRLRLFRAADLTAELRQTGFSVRTARSYGRYRLPEAHVAFIARKPA